MTFFQKIKIILQLLFIGSLFLLNAAVYQKYNYFAQARHLSYLPASSVLTVTVNANRLSGKMLYQFIYHNEEIMELLEELEFDREKNENVLQSGIDFTTQVSFATARSKDKSTDNYSLFLFDLSSRDNAIGQLGNRGFKKTGNENCYSRNKSQYAMFNNGVMGVFVFMDSTAAENDKLQAMNGVMDQKEKSEIGKAVTEYLEKGSDVVMYGLPENLFAEDSWMNYFIAYGEFKGDAFEFKVDFDFKRDVTSYFPENKVNEKFDFDNLDGYLYVKASVYATNASRLIEKLSFFNMNDSLQKIFLPVLHNQLAKGFELYGHGMKKAELKLPENAGMNMRLLAKEFYLPAFDFRLNCSDPQKIDTLLKALERQGRIQYQPNKWYLWEKDRYYKIYMALQNDWLNITTRPDASDQMPQTGYSNVIYFDANHLGDKLPTSIGFVFNENKRFDYFLLYTTGVSKNILHAKGKIELKKEVNSLIEGVRILKHLPADISLIHSFLSDKK